MERADDAEHVEARTTPARSVATPPSRRTTLRSVTPSSPVRVSPYPQRSRTPTRGNPRQPATHEAYRTDHPERADGITTASMPPQPVRLNTELFQLLVQPVVKDTCCQKDTTAPKLNPFVATGGTFDDILHRLWEKFHPSVEGKATKADDEWTYQKEVFITDWTAFFQLRVGRYRVPTQRDEASWNTWLASVRDQTVTLTIYKYGSAVATTKDINQFRAACIDPRTRDRAGAAAEVELGDIVDKLRERWGTTFQAPAAVWRMWANNVVRNLNRSTWEAEIEKDPPLALHHLIESATTNVGQQLQTISHNGHLALECVDGAIEDLAKLRDGWVELGRQIDMFERRLGARKRCVKASIRDARPLPLDAVIDPLTQIENVDDVDHQE